MNCSQMYKDKSVSNVLLTKKKKKKKRKKRKVADYYTQNNYIYLKVLKTLKFCFCGLGTQAYLKNYGMDTC